MITDLLDHDRTSQESIGMTTQEISILEYALMTETSSFYLQPKDTRQNAYAQTEQTEAKLCTYTK